MLKERTIGHCGEQVEDPKSRKESDSTYVRISVFSAVVRRRIEEPLFCMFVGVPLSSGGSKYEGGPPE